MEYTFQQIEENIKEYLEDDCMYQECLAHFEYMLSQEDEDRDC